MSKPTPRRMQKSAPSHKDFYKEAKILFSRMSTFLKSVDKNLTELNEEIQENRKLMLEVKKTNEHVEESAFNILLAIRQKEYLQAWYAESGKNPFPITEENIDYI